MRTENYHIYLNADEQKQIIISLLNLKNRLIEQGNIKGDNPSVAVTLECVYPVDSSKKGLESGRNEKIEKLNSMLKIYAEGEGLGMLDLTESLKSENGAFSSQYSDDGLHPNENGFAIVAEGLKSVLK